MIGLFMLAAVSALLLINAVILLGFRDGVLTILAALFITGWIGFAVMMIDKECQVTDYYWCDWVIKK